MIEFNTLAPAVLSAIAFSRDTIFVADDFVVCNVPAIGFVASQQDSIMEACDAIADENDSLCVINTVAYTRPCLFVGAGDVEAFQQVEEEIVAVFP